MSTTPDHRIVVGVDGSEHSLRALRWAADAADARGWALRAVAVWGYLDQRHADPTASFDPDYDECGARDALTHYVASAMGGDRASAVEHVVVCDLASRGLLDAAGGAALLVVGARGLGGFRSMLLGSVSNDCIHHAPCPVAVVRGDAWRPDPGSRRRIVAGVDGSTGSAAALRWAAEHVAATGAALDVVHAWHMPYVTGAPFAYLPLERAVFEEPARGVLERMMATIADVRLAEPATALLVQDRAASALLDLAKGADAVVVGTRGLGGFAGLLLGSVSDQIARHAACPVVVVPSQD